MAERETEENSCRKMSNSARRRNRKVLLLRAYDPRGSRIEKFFHCDIFRLQHPAEGEGGGVARRKESGEQQGKRVVPASVSTVQSANHPAIQPVGQPRSRESQRRVRRPRDRPSASLPWAHVAAPRAPLAYISDRSGSRSSCKWVGSNDILTCPVDRARSSKWMVVWLKNLNLCVVTRVSLRSEDPSEVIAFLSTEFFLFLFFFFFFFFFVFWSKETEGRRVSIDVWRSFSLSLSLSLSVSVSLEVKKGTTFGRKEKFGCLLRVLLWRSSDLRKGTWRTGNSALISDGFRKESLCNVRFSTFHCWCVSASIKDGKGAMRHYASSSSARCLATRFNPQLFYFFIYFFFCIPFTFFPLFSFLFFRLKRI